MTNKNKLWKLGEHRLIQADSTKREECEQLFENRIKMILTDPPYGVAYVEGKDWMNLRGSEAEHSKNHKKIANDQLQTDEEYAKFTEAWLTVARPFMEDYNTAHIFNSDLMMCALRQGMKDAGWKYSQMIIWVKNSIVLGRKDYIPQHEIIAYGWYGKHKFERAKSKSVIFHPKPSRSKMHPTMKPVGMLRKLILNTTKIGDIVYDPFGGSGSTLIACENLKRKCYMVEMDPDYCKVIIKRWEINSGKKAQKVL